MKTKRNDRKKQIADIVNAIRKKYLTIKQGRQMEDAAMKKIFRPITESVDQLSSRLEKPPKPEKRKVPPIMREQATDTDDPDDPRPSYLRYIPHAITDMFLSRSKGEQLDKIYGVYYDPNEQKLMMGNKSVNFHSGIVVIHDKRFPTTPGLMELLFLKHPKNFTDADLNTYNDIVLLTKIHKLNYDVKDRTRGNKSYKYNRIIKPLIDGRRDLILEKEGEGLNMEVNNKKIEYIYWDNINELVDRLRLLIASQVAGNKYSHNNEIISIIEELREAKVIY
jgi:hypothetical protein